MLREELARSERIVASNFDVMPRFRIMTPDGDYSILVPMLDDPQDRLARLKLVTGFMAWKMATAFVVAGENTDPNGIFCFAITHDYVDGVYRMIQRDGAGVATLGQIEPLSHQQCDPVFIEMLPTERAEIAAETLAKLEKVFGLGGEMEATRLH